MLSYSTFFLTIRHLVSVLIKLLFDLTNLWKHTKCKIILSHIHWWSVFGLYCSFFPHPHRSQFLMESKEHQSCFEVKTKRWKEFWPLLPQSPPPCSSSPFHTHLLPFPHQTHNFPLPAKYNFSSHNKALLLCLLSARGGRNSNNTVVKHYSQRYVNWLVSRAENCISLANFKINEGKLIVQPDQTHLFIFISDSIYPHWPFGFSFAFTHFLE